MQTDHNMTRAEWHFNMHNEKMEMSLFFFLHMLKKLHKWYFKFIIININRENIFSLQTKKEDDRNLLRPESVWCNVI